MRCAFLWLYNVNTRNIPYGGNDFQSSVCVFLCCTNYDSETIAILWVNQIVKKKHIFSTTAPQYCCDCVEICIDNNVPRLSIAFRFALIKRETYIFRPDRKQITKNILTFLQISHTHTHTHIILCKCYLVNISIRMRRYKIHTSRAIRIYTYI